MAERTLIIIKPDGLQRHLTGRIIARFERKGFKLVAAKLVQISEELSRQLYAAHRGKPFFERAVEHVTLAPCLVMVWEAEGIIKMARTMMGETFGHDALPGTIRGDFGCSSRYNLVHGADGPESAQREIELFFTPDEIIEYELTDASWLYSEPISPKI
jgi:nucleoside-diphosphate kinase